MRRLVWCAAALALAGCNVREAFTAHPDEAARAAKATLPAERLASLLVAGKNVQLTRQTADFVANLWVDYSLLAQAVAKGDSLTDSTTIAAAMWPQLTELRAARWHDSLMAQRLTITPATVDSIYAAGDIRVLQHILFGVTPTATPEERGAAKRAAQQVLDRIRMGGNFAQLAAQHSGDPGSKADGGYLPPGPRGRFVPAFDSAGWSLAPGGMTGLVETSFGYHIIRRPPLVEVGDRFLAAERQRRSVALDSLYLDSLATRNKLEIAATAPALMKASVTNPDAGKATGKTIASWKGGALTEKEFVKWVRALPPQLTQQLQTADDSTLVRFAKILSTNILLVREADAAGVTVTPEEWSRIAGQYRSTLDTLKAEMRLADSVFAGPASDTERAKAASLKVDQYFDGLVSEKSRLLPMPLALGQALRERYPWALSSAGLNRAVEIGKARQDSANGGRPAAPQGAPPTGLQRAPGPPPVPGAAPR